MGIYCFEFIVSSYFRYGFGQNQILPSIKKDALICSNFSYTMTFIFTAFHVHLSVDCIMLVAIVVNTFVMLISNQAACYANCLLCCICVVFCVFSSSEFCFAYLFKIFVK